MKQVLLQENIKHTGKETIDVGHSTTSSIEKGKTELPSLLQTDQMASNKTGSCKIQIKEDTSCTKLH